MILDAKARYVANLIAVTFVSIAAMLLAGCDHAGDEHETSVAALETLADDAGDDGAIADARGWSVGQAEAVLRAGEAVGRVAAKLDEIEPGRVVGSIAPGEAGEDPILVLKGAADMAVSELIRQEGGSIRVVDGQPYSRSELEERQQSVDSKLKELGYQNFATSAGILDAGRVTVVVQKEEELPSRTDEIRALLPEHLQEDTVVEVWDEPVFVPQNAGFGGMRNAISGTPWCTSGWTVGVAFSGFLLPVGVSTAGHCGSSINQIQHPGFSNHSYPYQTGVFGPAGDVQVHTVPNEALPARFYASNTVIRDVHSVKSHGSMSVNDPVCIYSRVQGQRICTAQIHTVSMSCTFSGTTVNNLVRMNAALTVSGDSGAGWSYNWEAWGSHVGICAGHSVFMPVSRFGAAINVHVTTI